MTTDNHNPSHPSDVLRQRTASPTVLRRVVAASFIGNFVEWFDYAVYGYLLTRHRPAGHVRGLRDLVHHSARGRPGLGPLR